MAPRFLWVSAFQIFVAGCFGVEKYGTADFYDHEIHSDREIKVIMPANAPYISEQFRSDEDKVHQGIDIWGKRGTPILASAPGRVTKSYSEPIYGNRVVINHGRSPEGDDLHTVHKHLDKRMVNVGDVVQRGQQIGTMGDTGALGVLVHLHFETMRLSKTKGEIYYDPHLVWMDGIGRVTCFDKNKRYPDTPFRTTYPVVCK